MRVAMLNTYTSNTYSMQNSLSQLSHLDEQMATGKRLMRPSDDAIGTVKVVTTERNMSETEQYIKNIDSLTTSLGRSETYLTSMVNLQGRMREITIAASNGSLSTQDREAYAAELSTLLDASVHAANSQDAAGNYIFSGNKVNTPAVALVEDPTTHKKEYVFQGDRNHRDVKTSSSSSIEANVTAGEFLFDSCAKGKDLLNQTQAFIDVLNNPKLSPGDKAFDDQSQGMLTTLNTTLNGVSGAITNIGGKQNSLQLMKSSHEQMVMFNKQVIGETESLDYPKAASEFQMKLTALQVSQKCFVKISQLNLFSQI